MRRKKPITLNLPPRLSELSTAYAEANGRSLSSLIEDLLRRHLEKEGVPVNVPAEELLRTLAEKFGISVPRASAEKPVKRKKKGGGGAL